MSKPLEIPLVRDGESFVGSDKSSTFVVYTDGEKPRIVVKPRQPRASSVRSVDALKEVFLAEIQRAVDNFAERDGYLGFGLFLTHWKSPKLPFGVDSRKPVVEALIEDGLVEVYEAPDGKDALRLR